jgi:membrane protein involved in colicin uptake
MDHDQVEIHVGRLLKWKQRVEGMLEEMMPEWEKHLAEKTAREAKAKAEEAAQLAEEAKAKAEAEANAIAEKAKAEAEKVAAAKEAAEKAKAEALTLQPGSTDKVGA